MGCRFFQALSKQLQAAQAAGASVVPDAGAPPATAAAPPAKATETKESKTKTAKATAAAAPTSGAEGSSSASASGAPSAAQIAALAPPLGVSPPLPPTGSGDCIGPVVGANGKNISVPCACPPAQADYVAALVANVQAGKAIHNPSVAMSFPTGSSKADQQARINAAAVTLQNLNGPGQGCPFASTTLGVRLLSSPRAGLAHVNPAAGALEVDRQLNVRAVLPLSSCALSCVGYPGFLISSTRASTHFLTVFVPPPGRMQPFCTCFRAVIGVLCVRFGLVATCSSYPWSLTRVHIVPLS
jgi:hypothetical protein